MTASHEPVLVVINRVDPDDPTQDEVFSFVRDGERRRFGRDHVASEIVVWSAHNGTSLGRVAGEIWRMDDELWVRNVSLTHELEIVVEGAPPEPPLRPRRSETDRGQACSIPAPQATILGPDGCHLDVRQEVSPTPELFTYGLNEPTLRQVPPVPPEFHALAVAMCEPLLLGDRLPAPYARLMTVLGEPSLTRMRRHVQDLCEYYWAACPQLAERTHARQKLQAEPPRTATSRMDDRPSRPRQFVLPYYQELAEALVRHHRVQRSDLQR